MIGPFVLETTKFCGGSVVVNSLFNVAPIVCWEQGVLCLVLVLLCSI